MAFLLKAIGINVGIPNFEFTPSSGCTEQYVSTSPLLRWTVRDGTADGDGRRVTLFSLNVNSLSSELARQLARNALKRAKSLMLPGMLKCHGGTEHDGVIYLAMEPCESLATVLAQDERRRYYFGNRVVRHVRSRLDRHQRHHQRQQQQQLKGSERQGADSESENDNDDDDDDDDDEDINRYANFNSKDGELAEAVSLGLQRVAQTVQTLHEHSLLHGNICASSVFISTHNSNNWKLFGFEFVEPFAKSTSDGGVTSSFIRFSAQALPPHRVAPELMLNISNSSSSGTGSPYVSPAVDSYGLGVLLYETLAVKREAATSEGFFSSQCNSACLQQQQQQHQQQGTEDLRAAGKLLHRSLQSCYNGLVATNPKTRQGLSSLLQNCAFIADSNVVRLQIAGVALASHMMDDSEKEKLYNDLAEALSEGHFPLRVALGELLNGVLLPQLSSPSSPSRGSSSGRPAVIAAIAKPILLIIGRLSLLATDTTSNRNSSGGGGVAATRQQRQEYFTDFTAFGARALMALFNSSDRLIRYQLLECMHYYSPLLSCDFTRDSVWPSYARGFESGAPVIREYTVRCLATLAPLLLPSHNEHNLVTGAATSASASSYASFFLAEIPRHVQTAHRDSGGEVRTNATVALCLLAPLVVEATREGSGGGGSQAASNILLSAFTRVLKDPFPPSRAAGVRAVQHCLGFFSAAALASTIIPSVAPLLLDCTTRNTGATGTGNGSNANSNTTRCGREIRDMALGIITASLEKIKSAQTEINKEDEVNEKARASNAAAAAAAAAAAGGAPSGPANTESNEGWGWGWGKSSNPTPPPPPPATTHSGNGSSNISSQNVSPFPPPSQTASTANALARPQQQAVHTDVNARVNSATTTTNAAATVPVPSSVLPDASDWGAGGWSDDDDDGLDFTTAKPSANTRQPAHVNLTSKTNTSGSSHNTINTVGDIPSSSSGPRVIPAAATTAASSGGGGGMKLRKKGGLGGASRID